LSAEKYRIFIYQLASFAFRTRSFEQTTILIFNRPSTKVFGGISAFSLPFLCLNYKYSTYIFGGKMCLFLKKIFQNTFVFSGHVSLRKIAELLKNVPVHLKHLE